MLDKISTSIELKTDGLESGVKKSADQLNKLENWLKRTSLAAQKTQDELNKTGESGGLKAATLETSNLTSALGSAGGAAGLAGVAILGIGVGLINAVKGAEKLNQILRPIQFLSGNESAQNLSFLKTEAEKTGLGFQNLAESYKGFAGALSSSGVTFKEINKEFAQISESFQVYGVSGEEAKNATKALTQIAGKGVVQMEELRGQLGEAMPVALGIASRAYGVTTSELQEMTKKGLDGVQFLRLFAAEAKKETSGSTAAVNTLTAAENRLTDVIQLASKALGDFATPAAIAAIDATTKTVRGLVKEFTFAANAISATDDAIRSVRDPNYGQKKETAKQNKIARDNQFSDVFGNLGDLGKNAGGTVTGEAIKYAKTNDAELKKIARDKIAFQREAYAQERLLRDQELSDYASAFSRKRQIAQQELSDQRALAAEQLAIKRGIEDINSSVRVKGADTSYIQEYLAKGQEILRKGEDAALALKKRNQDIDFANTQSIEERKVELIRRRYQIESQLMQQSFAQAGRLIGTEKGAGSSGKGFGTPGKALGISDLVAFGRSVDGRNGANVGQQSAFGRIGKHTPGSLHYEDKAIDINANNAIGGERARLKQVMGEARAAGFNAFIEEKGQGYSTGLHLHVDLKNAIAKTGEVVGPLVAKGIQDVSLQSVNAGSISRTQGADRSKLEAAQEKERLIRFNEEYQAKDSELTRSLLSNRASLRKADLDLSKDRASYSRDFTELSRLERQDIQATAEASRTRTELAVAEYDRQILKLDELAKKTTDANARKGLDQAKQSALFGKQNAIDQGDREQAAAAQAKTTAQREQALYTRNYRDSLADANLELEKNSSLLELQRQNIGLEADELAPLLLRKEREADLTKQIAEAKRQGLTLGQDEIDSYNKQTDSLVQLNQAQAEFLKTKNELTDLARGVGDAFGTLFKDLVDGGKTLNEDLSSFFGSIADNFLNMASKILSDAITQQLLSLFGGLGGSLASDNGAGFGGLVAGFTQGSEGIALTKYAKGGISTGPAIFGDNGAEAAVPLPDGRSIPVTFQGGQGGQAQGQVINISVVVNGGNDPQSTGDAVKAGVLEALVDARINKSLAPGGAIRQTLRNN
jgi:tape measure domain-containing protein